MADKHKKARNANQLAKFIVDLATVEEPEHDAHTSAQRTGGLKGGKARVDKLLPEERCEIAKKVANARWAD